MKKWLPYNLDGKILDSLRSLEFTTPTPIQMDSLPVSLSGDTDIIGAAQTGSGKTLAFALPIIQRILRERRYREKKLAKAGHITTSQGSDPTTTTPAESKDDKKEGVRALLVSPTRELALQIKQHIDNIALRHGIYTACIVGGMSQQKQERVLKQSPQIVVGTPGRLWELIENEFGCLKSLKELSFFVLDEADRMVEQGHYQELTYIIDRVPFSPRLQTFVFSATLTMPKTQLNRKTTKSIKKSKTSVSSIMQKIKFREKVEIFDLTKVRKVAAKLEESVVHCSEESRMEFLYFILATTVGRTLVFCNTISSIRTLLSILTNLGLPVSAIHAQQQQRQRLKALDNFKTGKKSILLATDVAARGLDIAEVRCVIQYQLPESSDTYVHRAGRTARAEADGLNILFVGPKNAKHFLRLRYSLKMTDDLPQFPVDHAVMPKVRARMSLAKKIDEISRLDKKQKSKGDWLRRNAEAAGIMLDEDELDDEDVVQNHSESRKKEQKVKDLQRQLLDLLSRPLQTSFSNKYLNPETITKAESELQSKAKLKDALKTKKKIKAEDILNRRGPEALHSIKRKQISKQKKKKR
jgi:ATP-dependent RNA helicase DDX24/MAK5